MGLGIVGLEPDRLAVRGDCVVTPQRGAKVVVGRSQVGLEADRLPERGHGGVDFPLAIQRDSEVIVDPGAGRARNATAAENQRTA